MLPREPWLVELVLSMAKGMVRGSVCAGGPEHVELNELRQALMARAACDEPVRKAVGAAGGPRSVALEALKQAGWLEVDQGTWARP